MDILPFIAIEWSHSALWIAHETREKRAGREKNIDDEQKLYADN